VTVRTGAVVMVVVVVGVVVVVVVGASAAATPSTPTAASPAIAETVAAAISLTVRVSRLARTHHRLADNFARTGEHRVDHRLRELAGKRVLLTGVIAADQRVIRAVVLSTVSEARPRPR
jgi:hypothetical protein